MKLEKEIRVTDYDALVAVDCLADHTGLPKGRIKDAMNKGAVWLIRGRQQQRLRRAKTDLKPGDSLKIFYDEALLQQEPRQARLIADREHYSVWYKPPGMLSQGSEWGDHCSLLRIVELHFEPRREVFLIHRLDREASGLLILAHNLRMAATLSDLFAKRAIEKTYRVEVLGDIAERASEGRIESPLDDQPAVTHYRQLGYNPYTKSSRLEVTIETGRKHQIRRHLADWGYPVLGDPRYGEGNKNRTGLQLKAVALRFVCPLSQQPVHFELPQGAQAGGEED